MYCDDTTNPRLKHPVLNSNLAGVLTDSCRVGRIPTVEYDGERKRTSADGMNGGGASTYWHDVRAESTSKNFETLHQGDGCVTMLHCRRRRSEPRPSMNASEVQSILPSIRSNRPGRKHLNPIDSPVAQRAPTLVSFGLLLNVKPRPV